MLPLLHAAPYDMTVACCSGVALSAIGLGSLFIIMSLCKVR